MTHHQTKQQPPKKFGMLILFPILTWLSHIIAFFAKKPTHYTEEKHEKDVVNNILEKPLIKVSHRKRR